MPDSKIQPGDENDTKEEDSILKFHLKREKQEKLSKKWDIQWLKWQEQTMKAKRAITVNVEDESLEPNVEDITEIVVDEMEEEPVLAFGFVVPKLSKVPFSLPWLFWK